MTSPGSNSVAVPLTAEQRDRLEEYLRKLPAGEARLSPIRRHATELLPLSYPQQQVWLHSQIAPDLPVYHETMTIYRHGPLDAAVLERAFNEILRRHEAWRINIRVIDGEPMQVIHPEMRVSLLLRDFSQLLEGQCEDAARRAATEEARRLFDLSNGPLFRALLCRLGPEEYRLYLTFHHIIFDGVSGYQIFWSELRQLYSAFLAGKPSPLPEPALQYSDFTLWQREWIAKGGIAKELEFWRREWTDEPEPLALPTDRPRPPVQSMRGALHRVHFSQALSEEIVALSRREGATPFMTLLTAFEILLQRYTGQDDFAVGTVGSGRGRSEFEEVLGCFQNPLVLRASLDGDPTFHELLQHNRVTSLEALSNADVPIEILVRELNLPHDPGRNPLFQVLFTVVPALAETGNGWQITQLDLETGASKFDIYLELDVQASGITGRFMYNTDLFNPLSIASMAAHLETLLAGIVAEPGARISDLPLLSEAERHRIVVEWNDTRREYPSGKCVYELFEAQAACSPASAAIVFKDKEWTYKERANRFSMKLRAMGVRPGEIVGVCASRSPELIAALLGILKAGAAYLPLDPELPEERLAFLLKDTSAGVVVTEHTFISRLPRSSQFLRMDEEAAGSFQSGGEAARIPVRPTDLAYVMHTSGSTGVPKGVAVSHRNIVRLLFGVDYARFGPDEIFLQLAPLSFDASTLEIWGPLLHGGRCVLYPGAVPSIEELGEVLQKNRVSTLWLTSSLFDAVIDYNPKVLRNVNQLLIGGEALSPPHVRRALEFLPEARISNGYGPTEGTTFTCCYCIPRTLDPSAVSIPIGRPIANTRAYILDSHGNPVPPGVVGELYIGGDGVARGYFNRPDLTAERFVANPFDADPAARLYRSGDRARFLVDGNIEFCGRTDSQVKIRGHRIEPGEVEAALMHLSDVKDAVVIVSEESTSERMLVAYWVPAGVASGSADDLRFALRRTLPAYMVPSAFVKLDHIPLTANGKVDRRQLRPPAEYDAAAFCDFKRPSDETESRLLHVWESVLGRSRIGVNDDFFELGGHSLLAVRLVHRIAQEFGRRLPLSALFQAPSVERMAALLQQEGPTSSWECLVPIEPRGARLPFFCIHGVGGTLLRIRELTRCIKEDQPIYGFEARGLDGNRPPLQTIQEMAALYIMEMRSLQPQGPYYLGGLSFGGIVAFEMAQQIVASGQEVGLLALFDTYPGKVESRAQLLRKLLSFPLGRIFNYVRRKTWGYIRTSVRAPLRMGVPQSLKDVKAACRQAAFRYVPQPYPGRVTLFRASDRALRGVEEDPQAGWGEWARGGVEIHAVPGTHMSMMTEPHVRLLALEVQECLERAQMEGGQDPAPSAVDTAEALTRRSAAQPEDNRPTDFLLSGGTEINRDQGTARSVLSALSSGAAADHMLLLSSLQRDDFARWNDTFVAYPPGLCVHNLFEAQVERAPDAVALYYGHVQFSYRELNERANRLAHFLSKRGVGPEIPVAVCVESSSDLIIALLAIMKAGGACVPLDPKYPDTRLLHMLRDSGARLLLTRPENVAALEGAGTEVICLGQELHKSLSGEKKANPATGVGPENLVYIVYTSGSTGQPKGVLLTHRGYVNHHLAAIDIYGLTSRDRVPQLSSISFDISVEEIFPTLAAGAALVLRTEELSLDLKSLSEWSEQQGVTVWNLPTALWHELVSELEETHLRLPDSLRLVIVGGERALSRAYATWRRYAGDKIRWVNTYGPTEASIVASYYEHSAGSELPAEVPIGRPLPNCRLYVLDANLQAVPPGSFGELYIGGHGVAHGYKNKAQLTEERFVLDPFRQEPGARMYRTGDLARWMTDGNLEFRGRSDEQVKIQGFRVEPGEVEAVLTQHPGLRNAAVVAREVASGDKRLVAYYVPESPDHPSSLDLRNFLKERLPEYMLPAGFVCLENMPLTANGKLDRQGLPPVEWTEVVGQEGHVAPGNETEIKLVRIWEDVFSAKPIGIRQSFFDLGGYSMLAVRLMHRIEREFGKRLPITALLQAPTIEGLAGFLQNGEFASGWSPLIPIQPRGSKPPLFCVHGIGGNVLNYRELAKCLGENQPFYALQAQGLDGKQPVLFRVEDMADRYLQEVRSVQPHGPYALGGLSFGGMVALEMASRLQRQGEDVALVALFETFAGREMTRKELLRKMLRLPPWQTFYFILRKIVGNLLHKWRFGLDPPLTEEIKQVQRGCQEAARVYVPPVFEGRLAFFQPKIRSLRSVNDETAGWGAWARGGLEICTVPGNHISMLRQPNVKVLAQDLNECLERAFSKETAGINE